MRPGEIGITTVEQWNELKNAASRFDFVWRDTDCLRSEDLLLLEQFLLQHEDLFHRLASVSRSILMNHFEENTPMTTAFDEGEDEVDDGIGRMIVEIAEEVYQRFEELQRRVSHDAHASSVPEDRMQKLLALNDKLGILLEIIQPISQHNDTSDNGGLLGFRFNEVGHKLQTWMSSSKGRGAVPPRHPKYVTDSLYQLRRGNNKESISSAIDILYSCGFSETDPEERESKLEHLSSYGCLEELLSVLQRCQDWPDVENRVQFMVVTLAASRSTTSILLQRHAVQILATIFQLLTRNPRRSGSMSSSFSNDHRSETGSGNRTLSLGSNDDALDNSYPLHGKDLETLQIMIPSDMDDARTQQLYSTASSALTMITFALVNQQTGSEFFCRQNGDRDLETTVSILLNTLNTLVDNIHPSDSSVAAQARFGVSLPPISAPQQPQTTSPLRMDGNLNGLLSVSNPNVATDRLWETSTEGDSDELPAFLLSAFDITSVDVLFKDLLSAESFSREFVDDLLVSSSVIIANLASVSRWRPKLVSSVLNLLCRSIRIATQSIRAAVALVEVARMRSYSEQVIFADNFLKLFAPTYDLIGSVSRALMLLAGGSEMAGFAATHPEEDFNLGWIDAQIVKVGLPTMVLDLLSAARLSPAPTGQMFDPFEMEATQSTNSTTGTTIDIGEVVDQIQTGIDDTESISNHSFDEDSPPKDFLKYAPRFLLPQCSVQYLVLMVHQLCTHSNGRNLSALISVPPALFPLCDAMIVRHNELRSSISTSSSAMDENTEDRLVHRILEYGAPSNNIQNVDDRVVADRSRFSPMRYTFGRDSPPTGTPASKFTSEDDLSPSKHDLLISVTDVPLSILRFCIEVFSTFLDNETSAAETFLGPSAISHLQEKLCQDHFMITLRYLTSAVGRSYVRQATLQLISQLSKIKEALEPLLKSSVMDAVQKICADVDSIGMTLPVPGLERKASVGSLVGSVFSTSSLGFRSRSHSISQFHDSITIPGTQFNGARNTPNAGLPAMREEVEELDESFDEIEAMECQFCCTALANICFADREFAVRAISNGLFSVICKVVPHHLLSVRSPALRCMHALCLVILEDSSRFPPDLPKLADAMQCIAPIYSNLGEISSLVSTQPQPDNRSIPTAIVGPSEQTMSITEKESIEILSLQVLACLNRCFSNDSLRITQIENYLRLVCNLVVHPNKSRTIRTSAELVLKSLGFRGGINDFEACSFDFELLRESFRIQQTLSTQAEGTRLIEEWYNWILCADSNCPCSTVPGTLHGSRDSTTGTADSRFILGKPENELKAHDLVSYVAKILDTVVPSSTNTRPEGKQRFFTRIFGGLFGLRSDSTIDSSANKTNNNGGNVAIRNSYHTYSSDRLPDHPPTAATALLDLFIPSKMQQAILMDLTSLGVCVPIDAKSIYSSGNGPLSTVNSITPITTTKILEPTDDANSFLFVEPRPLHINSVLLPSRTYHSFSRVARSLRRVIASHDRQQLWGLTFRNCDYLGDFHETLLTALQANPQISSLSFSNTNRKDSSKEEADGLFGNFVGQLPSSIRFVTLRGMLSRQSIQVLSIMLRQNNVTFSCTLDEDGTSRSLSSSSVPSFSVAEFAPAANNETNGNDGDKKNKAVRSAPHLPKGLMGLAVTHHPLATAEVDALITLLHPTICQTLPPSSARNIVHGVCEGFNMFPHHFANSYNASLASQGLRFLDLSCSSLSDVMCSKVIAAALRGPLEGLELAGNSIRSGGKVLEVLSSLAEKGFAANPNSLRYLGLARNDLSISFFISLLTHLSTNSSLTSLDLSGNSMEPNRAVNDAFKLFFKANCGLRSLDLSFNCLTTDCLREMQLGVLENHSLLLLNLTGNAQTGNCQSAQLIQSHLRVNRRLYAARCEKPFRRDASYPIGDITMFSRISRRYSPPQSNGEKDVEAKQYRHSITGELSTPFVSHKAHDTDSVSSLASSMDVSIKSSPKSDTINLTKFRDRSKSTSGTPDMENILFPPYASQVLPAPSSTPSSNNTLTVLLAAPLAFNSTGNRIRPVEPFDYATERENFIQVFREVHRDITVHFEIATIDSFSTALSFGCRALHFSGHGVASALCFEDTRSGMQRVQCDHLRRLMKAADGSPPDFVFLAACRSRDVAMSFIEFGVPHVVCVRVDSKIQDSSAQAFTRAFYLALLSGKTVKASFDLAREALKLTPYINNSEAEGDRFLLLPEDDPPPASQSTGGVVSAASGDFVKSEGRHNKVIFQNRLQLEWPQARQCVIGPNRIDLQTFRARFRLPSPPADFEGRQVDMHAVFKSIVSKRLVGIVGEDGIGKSAVAAGVCRYLVDREVFRDAVIYCRSKGIRDYASFLHTIRNAIVHSGRNSVSSKFRSIDPQNTTTISSSDPSSVAAMEDLLCLGLEHCHALLVIDHLDDLLADSSTHADIKLFLGRLLQQCFNIKILYVAVDSFSMLNINIEGAVDAVVGVKSLDLINSVRLFARLAPSLTTTTEKMTFISSFFQTDSNFNMFLESALLALVGRGHPSTIIHLASRSTPESVEKIKTQALFTLKASAEVHQPVNP